MDHEYTFPMIDSVGKKILYRNQCHFEKKKSYTLIT